MEIAHVEQCIAYFAIVMTSKSNQDAVDYIIEPNMIGLFRHPFVGYFASAFDAPDENDLEKTGIKVCFVCKSTLEKHHESDEDFLKREDILPVKNDDGLNM
jgi:hypothetical protein